MNICSTETEDDATSAYSDTPFALRQGTVYPEVHVPPKPSFDIHTKVIRGERGFSPISSKGSSESELILAAQVCVFKTLILPSHSNWCYENLSNHDPSNQLIYRNHDSLNLTMRPISGLSNLQLG